MKNIFFFLVMGVSALAFGLTDKQREELQQRIEPAGQVCLEGDSSCGSSSSASAGGVGKPADEIYNTYCMACHTTGAGGAPKIGDAGAWEERLGKGIEEVYANAINGINGMPPKGTCMSCSDEEIEAAVDHIVENSK